MKLVILAGGSSVPFSVEFDITGTDDLRRHKGRGSFNDPLSCHLLGAKGRKLQLPHSLRGSFLTRTRYSTSAIPRGPL